MSKVYTITISYVTCLIMLGIACFQMHNAFVGTLSPWKGGGYGMFSTQDSPGTRFLVIEAITELDEHVQIEVDSGFINQKLGLPSRYLSLTSASPNSEILLIIGTALFDIDYVDKQVSRLAIREHLRAVNPELSMRLDQIASPLRRTLVPADNDRPGHRTKDKESLKLVSLTVWRESFDLNRGAVLYEQFVGPVEVSN